MKIWLSLAPAAFCLLIGVRVAHAQTLTVYASAPKVQTAADSGYTAANGFTVETEGLESISTTTAGVAFPTPYVSPSITLTTATFSSTGTVGVYTGATSGNGEARYGGYGQGNFIAISQGTGNSATVDFNNPVGYFGFLFPAADAGSTIKFYGPGNALIGTFSTSDLTKLLTNNSTLTSFDGQTTYNSSSYYSQPTSGFNNGEPYAYLSFIPSGTTIAKAVLTESTAGSFEADNFSVMTSTPVPLGVFVKVSVVPEPAVGAALALGAGVIVLGRRAARRTA